MTLIHQEFESSSGAGYSLDLLPDEAAGTVGATSAFISIHPGEDGRPGQAISILPKDAAAVAALLMYPHAPVRTGVDAAGYMVVTVGDGRLAGHCSAPANAEAHEWLVNNAVAQLLAARSYVADQEKKAATEDAEALDDEAVALYNSYYEVEDSLEEVRSTDELDEWRTVARIARKLHAPKV